IQGRAVQVRDAFVIDKKLHSITFDYCVAFFSVTKRHLVMQTGTTAFRHFYSQAFSRVFRSLRKQTSELSNGIIRDVDHRTKNTAAAYPSQNRGVNHQVSPSDTRGNLNIKNRAGYYVMLSGAL